MPAIAKLSPCSSDKDTQVCYSKNEKKNGTPEIISGTVWFTMQYCMQNMYMEWPTM